MNTVTLTMTTEQHQLLRDFLFPSDGKESVAIALCTRAAGSRQHRLLVHEIHPVPYNACTERTPVNVKWNTDLIVPLLERAEQRCLSIIKIHSHPTAYNNFSTADDIADNALLPAVRGWLDTDVPHGSLIMLPDGQMFGRYYTPSNGLTAIDRIMVVGDDIHIWQNAEPATEHLNFAASHAKLFGEKTVEELSRLSIGVVGCSGTGSLVIEQLVRLGVGELVLVDHDHMSERNINRIVNSCMADAQAERLKVDVFSERITQIGLGTKIIPIAQNLWTANAIREIAQCDIVFGCMDSIDGRYLLNLLASYYLLPYFDLGVRIEAIANGPQAGNIREVCGTVHYLQPGKSSLISRGLISMNQVQAARLAQTDPTAYSQQLKDGYISGIQEQRPAVISVNMFIASLAVHELLCRLHPYREQRNATYSSIEFSLGSMEFFPEPEGIQCKLLAPYVGRGDTSPLLGMPAFGNI